MGEERRRQIRKWAIMGATGLVTGILALALFRAIPMASETAHCRRFADRGNIWRWPLPPARRWPALFEILKPKIVAYCPWAPRR